MVHGFYLWGITTELLERLGTAVDAHDALAAVLPVQHRRRHGAHPLVPPPGPPVHADGTSSFHRTSTS
jgi:hypothetical protein